MDWLRWLFSGMRRARGSGDSVWLYNRDVFQSLLERERMRVDRNGSVFSLIVASCDGAPTATEHLASVIRQRIRATDIAGWFDNQRIGLLLPDTPAAGAAKLASDLLALYGPVAPQPLFDIYTHPLDAYAEEDSVAEAPERRKGGRRRQVATPQAMQQLMLAPLPWWKRSLDVLGASLGLVALSPLLSAIAVAVKVTSPGPVLFAQAREGQGGRIFTMYKFRTMCSNAEALKSELRPMSEQDGPAFKLTNDPRVTPLGRYLRKSCLGELPQLWNVLRGEMTLVGPRPLPVDESRSCFPWQRRRLDLTPGLTCIWQVDGGRQVTFDEWMRMDLRYHHTRSASRDFGLIWRTLTKVILHRAST